MDQEHEQNQMGDDQETQSPTVGSVIEPAPQQSGIADIGGESVSGDQEQTITPEQSPSNKNQGTKKSKIKKILVWGLVLLLLAGGAYGAYKYYQNNQVNTTDNTQTLQAKKQDIPLIRYGTGEGVMNQFYPTLASDETTIYMNRQIFEGLVGFQDKTKIVPLLAESWTNPDNKTWIFTLKPNVKFHDGNTMTAKDVVYSYQQIKKNSDFSDTVTSTIKDVSVVDDTHVKITTTEVDPILLNRLTGLMIMDSAAAGKADPMYGTGPYMVKQGTKPDAQHIDLVAFDSYHGEHIYTKELQITVYLDAQDKPGSAEVQMASDVKNSKLDVVGFISGNNLLAAKTAGLNLFPVDDVAVYQLILNVNKKSSPISNLKVRQAVYSAIDSKVLMKAIGRTGTVANQYVPSFIPGYDSTITRPDYSIVNSKKLLKEAGYPNGINITLTAYSGANDAATEIQRQLKLAGINVTLDVESDVVKLQQGLGDGSFESVYLAQGSSFADAYDVFSVDFNTPYYTNAKISDLMTQANSTLDQTKRLGMLKEISRTASADVPIIPLYINQPTWVTNKKYVMNQDLLSNDLGVLFYKVYLLNQ